jgi:hypothetical protein
VFDIYSLDNLKHREAWESVQVNQLMIITKDELTRLPVKTATSHIPGLENEHVVMLEAFHQVHCLVSLAESTC